MGRREVLYDPLTEDREEVARKILQDRGMTLIPPFDDVRVMAGQGTVGLEVAEQARELGLTPDVVLVNCSGGGLASGVITALHHAFPGMTHHIVEPAGFDKMARSLATGHVCANPHPPGGLMDAISGPAAGARPLAVLRRVPAEYLIRAGRAACWYSRRRLPRWSRRRMSRRVNTSRSSIGVGDGRSGRALAMPWCGWWAM
ncbi:pyridoxal-phosphate dependent enzyme [Streptomyces violaceusniger]|uniref:pyridoxal-phosphate dependent enzyme n=1 Tax=Streptomyces violaceusniger TaxID=68280 RepID=UPI001AD7FF06|nr:pyridoxal-phosphate dependent enzyme [Streptomyces violaceusniger]